MSDEIPVGSPPVPHGRHAAPGGWYADPVDGSRERYWDGWQWTRNVRPLSGAAGGPAGQPSTSDPAAGQPGQSYPGAQPGQSYAPGQPGAYGPSSYGPAQPGPYAPGYAPAGYQLVPATADGVPLSGWWWRVLAFLIDSFLVYAVVGLIAEVTGLADRINQGLNAYEAYITEVLTTGASPDILYALSLLNTPANMIRNVLLIVVFVIYSGLMLKARGATLGKMLCRLRVVPLDQGRSAPGLPTAKAWLRPLVLQLMGLVWLLQLVDFLFPLWDKRKQTLHDKIVTTQVVREPRQPRV